MPDPKLFETNGPKEDIRANDPEDVYTKMMKTEGMEMGFEVNRPDPNPLKTFSKEALDTVTANMGLWVGTRILQRFRRTGRGARKLQVHVTVSLDGEVPVPMENTPFISFPDGHHKVKGRR